MGPQLGKQFGTFNMMDCVSVTDAEVRMGQPLCLAIELPGRTYYIKADDKESLRGWKKVCVAVWCGVVCVCTCTLSSVLLHRPLVHLWRFPGQCLLCLDPLRRFAR